MSILFFLLAYLIFFNLKQIFLNQDIDMKMQTYIILLKGFSLIIAARLIHTYFLIHHSCQFYLAIVIFFCKVRPKHYWRSSNNSQSKLIIWRLLSSCLALLHISK